MENSPVYSSIRIPSEEYATRCEALLHHLQDHGCTGVVIFDTYYILYYTGFAFIPTERPVAFLMNSKGEKALFVPRLEVEHASSNALVEQVFHYIEYPYTSHPMQMLSEFMLDMGIRPPFCADQDGYPRIQGYRGPKLGELTGASPLQVAAFIEDCMMVKSTAELALIRESIRWGNLAHTLLQRYTRVGASETQVSQRASMEAVLAMLDAIGPLYRANAPSSESLIAGYRGQIGRNAAIPHALAANITFQPGDVLVTGAGVPVWGYNSELERTMIIGSASDAQKEMFEHMLALQDIAFKAIQPGVPCSQVDLQVRGYYEAHQLMPYWKHHVGHAIGLRDHEGPFLDMGDHTVIRPGMVFTVEPGLYLPELGGFRHSDTVVVTEDGIEVLTYYPRDLASLTLPL